jgi:hypothetical protein
VRSVAIETPSNESYEPGAEFVVADALRREFLRRRSVKIVSDASRADLVLSGRVRGLRTRAVSLDSVGLALEYELTLEIDLEATRSGGDGVPIDAGALRGSERYLASADAEAARKNRREALRLVATVLAGRVYGSLYETLSP